MDFVYFMVKTFVENGPLKWGSLATLLGQILTPLLLYPHNQLACTLWVANGRPTPNVLGQWAFTYNHPCQNALGLMTDGINPLIWHVVFLLPFAAAVIYTLIRKTEG